LKQTLADALAARGYDTLTAVQEAVSGDDVIGRDLLVSAQTGSGKTIGFGIAIAPKLLGDAETFSRAGAPLALVIAPTRELALQVKRELEWLYKEAGAVVTSTVGGMDIRDERRALERGAHIVVATPGRLRDHVMRGTINMDALRAVVLDEADEMLDLGFREDLEFILDSAPDERQTLLFSATVPAAIAKLAQRYQTDAMRIATTSGAQQHSDIEYRALRVSPRDGENAIINLLRYYEAPNAIVFCNTRATVNRLTTRLSNRGLSVVALSGELTQSERTNALQAMRDGRARVCVATDVAARGIDLPNLQLVIHAELPSNQDTLLHRSGRTGRAGRKGVSAMIVPPAVRKKAERLLGWAKLTAEWADAPSADEVLGKDEERMLASPAWNDPITESDRDGVDKLTAQFNNEQIAAAYLRLYRERHSAPEELSDVGAPPAPRQAFGPSVWFSLAGGRATGAEPRRLLPMLCKMGNITKDDIGAIRIQDDASYIELREAAVDGFVKAVGAGMKMEDDAALTRLPGKPKIDTAPRLKKAWDKPRVDRGDAPKRDDYKARKPKGTTAPHDYDDAPAPRAKKPKTGGKPTGGKPSGSKPAFKKKPFDDTRDGAVSAPAPKKHRKSTAPAKGGDAKPSWGKPGAGKTGGGDKPKGGKPKGAGGGHPASKPPAGKPSSKKNRARQAAVKAPKGKGSKPPRT
jgi:ATP-dependent RNA helicase DeaD